MTDVVVFRRPPMRDVIRVVSRVTGVSAGDLTSERRFREVVGPRQIAMWIGVRHLSLLLPHVGRSLNRDHTTVLHGVRRIDGARAADPALAQRIDEMCAWVDAELARPPGDDGAPPSGGEPDLPVLVAVTREPAPPAPPKIHETPQRPPMQPFELGWWQLNNDRFIAAMRVAHPEREIQIGGRS